MKSRKNQKGLTLVELILTLALAGLILFGIFSAYSSAKQSSNIKAESTGLQTLVAGVRSLYPGSPNYTGVGAAQLITAGKAPQSMVNGTALRNVWGGAITVAANATAGFDVTYAAVPTSSCIEIITTVGPSFNVVAIGATTVKAADAEVNVATATTACSAAATATIRFNSL